MFDVSALLLAAATPVTYPVAVTIRQGDRVIGTPRMTVTDGEPAVMLTDRYALKLIVSPDPASGRAHIISAVSLKRDGTWTIVAQPNLIVAFGTDVVFEKTADRPGDAITLSYRVESPR